jgi:hypothetical protein
MSIIFDLATLQVDYTAAFVHADIDKPPNWDTMMELERERSGVYIEMPRGFGEDGKVLKLKNSLYGLKQSPSKSFLLLNYSHSRNPSCARTYAQTNPRTQRATQLRSVLARVYSVSRQNLNTTTVP